MHTEPIAEMNVPSEMPPTELIGEHEVEISQGLGLASLNINFCQQT